MKPVKVGILGLGTVGSGTFNVLKRNQKEIRGRAGRNIEVVMVADRNVEMARKIVNGDCEVVADGDLLVNNPDIDIVVELIGGYGVAKDFVLKAIANGKHVVTANKALLALHGNEIFEAAQNKKVIVAFEAAVAGGIPIIKALREGLTANRIEWIAGIINGTTNFILSEMREKGLDFDTVLKNAQELGYAESDPTFDIEGFDAAHKVTIMSSLAFGIPVQFDKAYVEGINRLEAIDIKYAEQLGYRIKLLGITKRMKNGIELRVHPTLIPSKRLIANVEGAMNAVLVNSDAVGASLYYGKGAGSEPTASAVIADLVDIARLESVDPEHRVPHLAFQPDAFDEYTDTADVGSHHQLLPENAGQGSAWCSRGYHAYSGRPENFHRCFPAEGTNGRGNTGRYHHPDAYDTGKEYEWRHRKSGKIIHRDGKSDENTT